jgi:hypothetical protein
LHMKNAQNQFKKMKVQIDHHVCQIAPMSLPATFPTLSRLRF